MGRKDVPAEALLEKATANGYKHTRQTIAKGTMQGVSASIDFIPLEDLCLSIDRSQQQDESPGLEKLIISYEVLI